MADESESYRETDSGSAPVPLPTTNDLNAEERVGAVVGPYKLLRKLGKGGMGVVWLAEQSEPVKRRVALKIIKTDLQGRQVVARFEAERQALALMDHPNIARVLDAGSTPAGRPYFVMELVKGVPFNQYCDQEKLTLKDRLELFIPVCNAVQHAHQKGIVHRDLKPSNVLVALYDGKPVPKVIDFGVAKATHQKLTEKTMFTDVGHILGTLEYMAPEQAELNNLDIDTRADIYSLGVMLYELLTGAPPFSRKQLMGGALDEMLRMIREVEPSKPSTKLSSTEHVPTAPVRCRLEPRSLAKLVRGDLDWIVMKCLEKERGRRYDTASQLGEELNRFLRDEPVQAGPPSVGYRTRKFLRRNRGPVIAAGLVLTALVLGIVGTGLGFVVAEQARAEEAKQRKIAEKNEKEALKLAELEKKATRKALKATKLSTERLKQIEIANGLLESIFKDINPQHERNGGPVLMEQLMNRLRAVAAKIDEEEIGDSVAVARLQSFLGATLNNLGDQKTAIMLYVKANATYERVNGPTDRETLASAARLAYAYRFMGERAKALSLFEDLLVKMKAALGPNDPDTINAMGNIGAIYSEMGQTSKALPLIEEALAKTREVRGPDHPNTLYTMCSLAHAYRDSGKPEKAVPIYEEILAKMKTVFGPDHAETLHLMTNLALAYRRIRRFDKSLPLYEEAIDKWKATLGPNHAFTLNAENDLAAAYREAGLFSKAFQLEEAIVNGKLLAEPERPETLTRLNNLADAFRKVGQLAKALPLYEQALALKTAKYGPDHIETLTSMSKLANLYRLNRQFDKALPLFEAALAKQKEKLGSGHKETLITMNNLAVGYQTDGQLFKALSLYEEMAEKSTTVPSPGDRTTLVRMTNQAWAYRSAGQFDKAAAIYAELVALAKKTFPPDHPEVLNRMHTLFRAYLAANEPMKALPLLDDYIAAKRRIFEGNDAIIASDLASCARDLLASREYVAAEPMLRESLTIRSKMQPKQWTTFSTQSMLGASLLGQKKHKDAEPLLKQGYEGMEARKAMILPGVGDRLTDALERLVRLYEETDRKDEAAKWSAILDELDGKRPDVIYEVEKELTIRSELDEKATAVILQVRLKAGATYAIEMVSPDRRVLLPYLYVRDSNRKLLAGDDEFANLNARFVFRARADGIYQLRATSFSGGSGPFTVKVRQTE